MRILLVGGSGMVGTFVTPYLAKKHTVRVLDVVPPKHADLVEYIPGSIDDPEVVDRALEGMDSFVTMVMRNAGGANETEQTPESIRNNYQVNVSGLHLFLWTAQSRGITRGVHVSTRSVHFQRRTQDGRIVRYESEETSALDAASIYGFTKGIGERVCQYFCSNFGMRIIALRITGPRTREAFLAERRNPIYPELYVMDEEDLADAILRSLEVVQVGSARFDPVLLAADEHQRDHNITKAKLLLGWEPRGHRLLEG